MSESAITLAVSLNHLPDNDTPIKTVQCDREVLKADENNPPQTFIFSETLNQIQNRLLATHPSPESKLPIKEETLILNKFHHLA